MKADSGHENETHFEKNQTWCKCKFEEFALIIQHCLGWCHIIARRLGPGRLHCGFFARTAGLSIWNKCRQRNYQMSPRIHVEGENHERKSRGAWSFCILENQRLETGSFEQKGWWRPHRSTTPQGQQFVIISQWSDTGVCGAFATRSGCHGGIFNTPAWVQNKDNGKEAGQQRASLSLGLFFKVFCAKLCKAAVACGFWWFFKVCRVPHSWRVRRVAHVETIHF